LRAKQWRRCKEEQKAFTELHCILQTFSTNGLADFSAGYLYPALKVYTKLFAAHPQVPKQSSVDNI
jgi:hypothetical protein